MKNKTYRSGNSTFRAYQKTVGNGVEVGFVTGTKTIFVGNFIHTAEANRWYSTMNTEIRSFCARYKVGPSCPKNWFTHFMSDHLYKKYYTFLNKAFVTHNRKYTTAVNKDVKKYNRISRNWYPSEKGRFLKAA
jgi:hypothetical protein